jgi:hypothetical protein
VSTPIENITVDPRPGGVFETIMVNDADDPNIPAAASSSKSPHQSDWYGASQIRA